jgi:quercetin dioxygenase-like cupin family protein
MNPEEAVSLAGLVDYQDDSVVSRTLMKKETGTLTVFAFEAGQALSEHRAPFDALVQVLEGEAVITISGKEHQVRAGEAILMPAQDPHAVRADVSFKMLLTMLRS